MIKDVIFKYHEFSLNDENHRFRSWEHCNKFFMNNFTRLDRPDAFDSACLHLAFYLASWGMLRGSSFLLQKDYRIHKHFIESVVMNKMYNKYFLIPKYGRVDDSYFKGIEELFRATENAYVRNIKLVNGEKKGVKVSDTLLSKIILGVYGCIPAYDRYFKDGLRLFGIRTKMDSLSLEELLLFYNNNINEFSSCYETFNKNGVCYTPMKLMDMYFWKVGAMIEEGKLEDSMVEFATKYKNESGKNNIHRETNNASKRTQNGTGLTDAARKLIAKKLIMAKERGDEYFDVRAGNIQKEMNISNRIPAVCNAMRSIDGFEYEVISQPPKGNSTTVVYRYKL